jgi:hypothetical protein
VNLDGRCDALTTQRMHAFGVHATVFEQKATKRTKDERIEDPDHLIRMPA